jgi:hypothetical protein
MDPAYLQIFLLKYICSPAPVAGTLAPQCVSETVQVCNICQTSAHRS